MRRRSSGLSAISEEDFLEKIENTPKLSPNSETQFNFPQVEFKETDEVYEMVVKSQGLPSQDQIHEIEERKQEETILQQVKRNIMFIGAQEVGKNQLIQRIFREEKENSSFLFDEIIRIKRKKSNSEGDKAQFFDLESLQNLKIDKRDQHMKGKSLDYLNKKVYNSKLDRQENYHIWVQNLSVNNFQTILENVYYKTAQIIVFIISYTIEDSLKLVLNSYKKILEQKSAQKIILVAIGDKENNVKMYNNALDFSKKCDHFIEIDDFCQEEKIDLVKCILEDSQARRKKSKQIHKLKQQIRRQSEDVKIDF